MATLDTAIKTAPTLELDPLLNPPPLIIHPAAPHTHETTLILLHGTSTSGSIFADDILNFPIPISTPSPSSPSTTTTPSTLHTHLPTTRLIFPSGSPKPLTVLNLPTSNSWFDIHSFADRTLNAHLAVSGLAQSVAYLRELIRSEVEILGGDARRVVVLGFSSGCAVGVLASLSLVLGDAGEGKGIGGFIGMSGYLPFRAEMESAIGGSASTAEEKREKAYNYLSNLLSFSKVPVTASSSSSLAADDKTTKSSPRLFFTHGKADTKMRPEWGRQMTDLLGEGGLGFDVQVKEYEGLGHELGGEEMVDVVQFLRKVWGELEGGVED